MRRHFRLYSSQIVWDGFVRVIMCNNLLFCYKLAQEAKERQGERNDIKENIKDKCPESDKKEMQVRDQLGEIAGVSGKTIDMVETILNKGTKEDIQEVRTGKASISGKAKGECVKYV